MTIVIGTPARWKNWPSSLPTYPPPSTISDFGGSSRSSAASLSMKPASASPGTADGATLLPVAITNRGA